MRDMKRVNDIFVLYIPTDWRLIRVKELFSISRGRVIAKTELDDMGKYPVYSSQTKNGGCMGYINTYDFEGERITWTTDGANAGSVFFREGKYNCTNVCGILTPRDSFRGNFQYIAYALGCMAFYHKRYDINGFKIMSNEMSEIQFPYPIIKEQESISSFLNKKCTQIHSLISNQEKQIEKLKAYKQSVITEAVTHGLDPTVPMKDSGVEWIGKIPTSWKVVQLSSLFIEHKKKNYDMLCDNLLSLSYGRIIRKDIRTTDGLLPESFEGYNVIDSDDIVLRLTDLQNDKKSLRVGLCNELGIITSAYVTLRKRHIITNSHYQFYYLYSFDIRKGFYGMGSGVRQGLNYEEIRKLALLLPSNSEQKPIVSYIDEKCSQIDRLIAIKQQKIEKLNEYKKSLIYEYVTGKKEVV